MAQKQVKTNLQHCTAANKYDFDKNTKCHYTMILFCHLNKLTGAPSYGISKIIKNSVTISLIFKNDVLPLQCKKRFV